MSEQKPQKKKGGVTMYESNTVTYASYYTGVAMAVLIFMLIPYVLYNYSENQNPDNLSEKYLQEFIERESSELAIEEIVGFVNADDFDTAYKQLLSQGEPAGSKMEFLHALVAYKTGDIESTKSLLTKVTASESNQYFAEANNILEKLD